MIIFLYGEDSYRTKEKLKEIISGYKKVHKSGLNLIYMDAKEKELKDLMNNFKIVSMFAEKKLVVLKNVFVKSPSAGEFQEELLKEIKTLEGSKDIVVIFEEGDVDQRSKLFKALKKEVKCQEFEALSPALLLNWIKKEFEKNNAKISLGVDTALLSFVGNDLWKMQNEIKKLSNFKKGKLIERKDVELIVKPKIESDIFKTIDAIAQKDKRQALSLLHKHLESGENVLYLLTMFAYQFKNLLIIKDLIEKKMPYSAIAKESKLHPFVVKKTYYMCQQFSFEDLKKIYAKIFQMDLNIKIGKIEPETALDLFIAEI